MPRGDAGASLIALQARLCHALADPKRICIIYLLGERSRTVGELAAALESSVANVSQHLAVLRGRGLVRGLRQGTTVTYSLADPAIVEACDALRGVLQRQLADRRRFIEDLIEIA